MLLITSFVILLVCFNTIKGQQTNQCNQLLDHGVYDTLITDNAGLEYQTAEKRLCSAYQEFQERGQSVGAEVIVEGFGIGGSWSNEKLQAMGQYFCEDSGATSLLSSSGRIINQTVDPIIVSAWEQCNEQFSAGLFVNRRFNPNLNPTTLSIDIQYKPDFPPDNYTITDVIIRPQQAFTCKGNLMQAIGKENGATGLLSMLCDRNVSENPIYNNDGQLIKAPVAIIDIETSVGVVSTPFAAIVVVDFTHAITNLNNAVVELETQIQQSNNSLSTQLQQMNTTLTQKQIQSGSQNFGVGEDGPVESLSAHVDFPTAFASTPTLQVSLCGVDSGASSTKMALSFSDVNVAGFNVVANAWSGSRLYGYCLSWIAYTQ